MILSHQKVVFKTSTLIEKVTVKAPFRFAVNFPDEACFIYFEEGNTKVNSPFDQVTVDTDNSVLLKCGTYFANLLENNVSEIYKITVVHLPRQILKELYVNDFPPIPKETPGQSIRRVENHQLIHEFIKGLHFYLENPTVVSDALLSLKIKELILLLIETKNAQTVRDLLQQLFTPQEINLKEVVESHLYHNLSIEDLASLCHVSVSTFKRQFKSIFSDSPANYLKSKRLQRAKELLAVSQLSIGEIAYQTGFSDVAHFSRSFKAYFNLSPSILRKQ